MGIKNHFIKYIIALTCFCLIALPGIVFAKSIDSEKVLFESREITDSNILYNRALNGISDLDDKNLISEAKLVDQTSKIEYKVKTYKTTQHLRTIKKADGQLDNEYATTVIAIAYPDEIQNGSVDDPTYGVRVYSTAYFHIAEIDTLHLKTQHYRTQGSWKILDPTYTLTTKRVSMYTLGSDASTGNPVNQVRNFDISGFTYDKTASLPWISYDNVNLNIDDCGTTIYTVITRGGSSWDFYVTNKILGPTDIE